MRSSPGVGSAHGVRRHCCVRHACRSRLHPRHGGGSSGERRSSGGRHPTEAAQAFARLRVTPLRSVGPGHAPAECPRPTATWPLPRPRSSRRPGGPGRADARQRWPWCLEEDVNRRQRTTEPHRAHWPLSSSLPGRRSTLAPKGPAAALPSPAGAGEGRSPQRGPVGTAPSRRGQRLTEVHDMTRYGWFAPRERTENLSLAGRPRPPNSDLNQRGDSRGARSVRPTGEPPTGALVTAHMLQAIGLSARESPAEGYSRSPGLIRRCASRARSSAAEAPYLWSIWRDRHPASRMRSPSLPPCASQA